MSFNAYHFCNDYKNNLDDGRFLCDENAVLERLLAPGSDPSAISPSNNAHLIDELAHAIETRCRKDLLEIWNLEVQLRLCERGLCEHTVRHIIARLQVASCYTSDVTRMTHLSFRVPYEAETAKIWKTRHQFRKLVFTANQRIRSDNPGLRRPAVRPDFVFADVPRPVDPQLRVDDYLVDDLHWRLCPAFLEVTPKADDSPL